MVNVDVDVFLAACVGVVGARADRWRIADRRVYGMNMYVGRGK